MALVYFVNPQDCFLEKKGDRAPLGLGYLCSWTKKLGHQARIIDLNHASQEDLLRDVLTEQPTHICFSVSTPNYTQCIELAQKIRAMSPAKLIAGGNHVTDLPNEIPTLESFDYIIVGEGEQIMHDVLEGRAKIGINIGKSILDVDSIPMPDYDELDMNKYTMTINGKPGAIVITSRGCLYNCSYCGSSKIKKWRGRTPQNVIEEMKVLHDKWGKRGFYFADDIFSKDKKRTIELCESIARHFNPEEITIRLTTRADLLDEEILIAMKKCGVDIISLGCESGNDEILRAIHKGMTVQQNKDCIELCHKHSIKVKGFFIIGLPGETEQTIKNTVQFVKDTSIDFADFYPLTPYPGTQIWNKPERYGLEIDKPVNNDWNNYYQVGIGGAQNILFKHPNLSSEQILEAIRWAKQETQLAGMTS